MFMFQMCIRDSFKFVHPTELKEYLNQQIYNDIIITLQEYENMKLEE